MSDWKYGAALDFWSEDKTPSGNAYCYVFDFHEPTRDLKNAVPTDNLLTFLSNLNVIDYGCFYESYNLIRIRT